MSMWPFGWLIVFHFVWLRWMSQAALNEHFQYVPLWLHSDTARSFLHYYTYVTGEWFFRRFLFL